MGILAAFWGLIGIFLIIGGAIYRLTPIGLEAFTQPLHWYHWLFSCGWILFMAYSEGYRGFQKGFSPRVAARVAYLHQHPTPLRLLLAPLFCMGYFHIERRRQIITFIITLLIISVVQIVHQFAQPWRGIVDLGVVIGLAWGLIALWVFTYQAFTNPAFDQSPLVPEALQQADRPA